MSKNVFVAIFAVLLLKPATVVAQPIQWEGNGHFYEFVEAPGIQWTDARNAAATMQHNCIIGHLLTSTSSDENDFVRDTFSNGTGTFGWIGASDSATEGEWLWVDGPEVGIQFWQGDVNGKTTPPLHFANWACQDPCCQASEDFAVMALGNFLCVEPGEWGDANNAGAGAPIAGYFVEYEPEPCLGDLDFDGAVSAVDLAMLLGSWGPCADPDDCPADIQCTGDGVVGAGDLAVLLGNWGPCEP